MLASSAGYTRATPTKDCLSRHSLSAGAEDLINDIKRRRYVTSDLNRAISAAFNMKGIEIPFPQRDVNFRGPLQVDPEGSAPPSPSK